MFCWHEAWSVSSGRYRGRKRLVSELFRKVFSIEPWQKLHRYESCALDFVCVLGGLHVQSVGCTYFCLKPEKFDKHRQKHSHAIATVATYDSALLAKQRLIVWSDAPLWLAFGLTACLTGTAREREGDRERERVCVSIKIHPIGILYKYYIYIFIYFELYIKLK